MRLVSVINTDRTVVIGDRIEVAETSLTRMVGLLGRTTLESGRGLWIRPSSGVHTLFMRLSIDVIGLDKNLNVIKLWPDLVPWRLTSVSTRLRSVVELPAGTIHACGVQLGDHLEIR